MQNELNPTLQILKMQAVSYAHQDPMLLPDAIGMQVSVTKKFPLQSEQKKIKSTTGHRKDMIIFL